MTRPRLLILAFSPIARDARVLKQVDLFRGEYHVTTVGYEGAPAGVDEHIQIPDSISALNLSGRLITLHWYRRAYESIDAVRWSRQNLDRGRWDVVLANDVETVPVALGLMPRYGVHADLHEYSPRLHEQVPAWKRRIKPFYDWLCRRYVRKASSWTTVGAGLAREYQREFGFLPQIVTNAAPYAELSPTAVESPLRLVHSGACLRDRNLMALLEGVERAETTVTLDLFITPNEPAYLDELTQRAGLIPGVTINAPVPYAALIERLNQFDVGVHILPPVNFNNEWALPNKLFDYIQARLAVVVGPSAEMAGYVREYGLGVVTDDFTSQGFAKAIDTLTVDHVGEFKEQADRAAPVVSSQSQVGIWLAAIENLLASDQR